MVNASRSVKRHQPSREMMSRTVFHAIHIGLTYRTPFVGERVAKKQISFNFLLDKENYDEDGWDEVYEIDVGEVEEEEMDYGNQLATKGRIEERPTTMEVHNSHPVTSSVTPGHLVNSGTSQSTVFPSNIPARGKANLPRTRIHHQRVSSERAPLFYDGQTDLVDQESNTTVYQTNQRTNSYPDKNNVNITVQSCPCRQDKGRPSIEEERLTIEKQRLDIERQRLEVEKERLQIERERLQIEKRGKITEDKS